MLAALAVLCALVLAMACRPRAPRQPLMDNDPVFVNPAIKRSAQAERLRDVPRLIELLDSDDSAIRLYASHALRDLTGESFGYQFWASAAQRQPAIDRWKRWAAAIGLIPEDQAPPPAEDPAPAAGG